MLYGPLNKAIVGTTAGAALLGLSLGLTWVQAGSSAQAQGSAPGTIAAMATTESVYVPGMLHEVPAALRPTPTPTTTSGSKIVFSSNHNGNFELYTMDANGANPTNITNSLQPDEYPDWSPNGQRITFETLPPAGGPPNIFAINADGSSPVRLTYIEAGEWAPAWSPDGTKIVFQSFRDDNWEIYVMEADGDNQTNLTDYTMADEEHPTWSPDGSKIAFTSDRGGTINLWVMDADGQNPVNLTNGTIDEGAPDWSPDGTQIAYECKQDSAGTRDICVIAADGSGTPTRLTTDAAGDAAPAWSPDGTKIAFQSNRDGNWEIYVMSANGQNQTRLTNDVSDDQTPAWSPF